MKTKILLPIIALLCGAAGIYFLAPLQAWKKGTIINKQKKTNSGYEEFAYSPQTCNYLQFCCAWWQAYFGKKTADDEDTTYNGGKLEEITVTGKRKPENITTLAEREILINAGTSTGYKQPAVTDDLFPAEKGKIVQLV